MQKNPELHETASEEPVQESHHLPELSDEMRLTKAQKKRILTVLFGRLINMHKNIMTLLGVIHVIIILVSCLHIFTLGTVDSEKNACYLTWPLTHLFYAFINYIFAWFFCYNSCEITNPENRDVLKVSKRFLKILLFFSVYPVPLRYLAQAYCRNWTLSWSTVIFQTAHVMVECLLMWIYFFWFERKYAAFRIFYKEAII